MFNVSMGVGMLKMSLGLPGSYRAQTQGLLGDFDGDSQNDLKPRDSSTHIAATSTERQVFAEFGQTCKYMCLY